MGFDFDGEDAAAGGFCSGAGGFLVTGFDGSADSCDSVRTFALAGASDAEPDDGFAEGAAAPIWIDCPHFGHFTRFPASSSLTVSCDSQCWHFTFSDMARVLRLRYSSIGFGKRAGSVVYHPG